MKLTFYRRFNVGIFNLFMVILFFFISTESVSAEPQQDTGQKSIFDATLEELLSYKIITSSKKETDPFTTPASVYVLTAEDIKHSGVNSIPEALRLVPGVEVAQINTNGFW